jgi:hypothetical protein
MLSLGAAAIVLAACGGADKLAMANAARTESGSWQYMLDSMSEAAKSVDEIAQDDLERREGYRLLARTAALGFDRFLEYGRGDIPDFFRLQSAHRKFAGDNPDQLYHASALDGQRSYRIRGRMWNSHVRTVLVEFSVYGGGLSFDDANAKRRLIAHLDESELQVEADGSFELTLSPEAAPPSEANWIQLEDDAEQILVRRYFAAPQISHPLPLSIELSDEAPSTAPLDQRGLAKGLIGSGAFVRETVKIWGNWYAEDREKRPTNALTPLQDNGDLLTPAGMTYVGGTWALEPGEALVIKFTPPDIPYWGFLPMNVWMESLDWRVARVTLNNFNAEKAADGSVTIVLADQDSGVPNALVTLGHHRGMMSLRLARLEGKPLPVIETRVVPLASIAEGGLAAAFER